MLHGQKRAPGATRNAVQCDTPEGVVCKVHVPCPWCAFMKVTTDGMQSNRGALDNHMMMRCKLNAICPIPGKLDHKGSQDS